jgi:hypothetical protein
MSRQRVLAAVLLPMLASCSAATSKAPDSGQPTLELGGFVIQNALVYPVTDVLVEAPATGRFAGCGNIPPRSECRNAFESIDYRKNEVVVSWKERGEARSTDPFMLDPPAGAEAGATLWLEVVIYAPGLAGARLVQP